MALVIAFFLLGVAAGLMIMDRQRRQEVQWFPTEDHPRQNAIDKLIDDIESGVR